MVEPLPEAVRGDVDCAERVRIGSRWVHLRRCATCSEVGRCDGSPERHARPWGGDRTPDVASAKPGERGRFGDDVAP